MKRINLIITTMALVLGFVQCGKKREETISYNKKAVNITLDVGNGSKTNVDPLTGKVTFADGDKIYVASNEVYVGTLVCEDGVFRGTVTGAITGDYLYFYHLGNCDVGTLIEGETTYCGFRITDQINSLPVISYAHSTELFDGEGIYTARLNNRCALVKFNVTTSSRFAGTCITGMANAVSVDFTLRDGEFAIDCDVIGDGVITLAPGNGERWAILFPQEELPEGGVGSAFSGRYTGTLGAVPEIHADDYLDEGIPVVIDELTSPQGALPGEFSINSNGDKVCFSKSNLLYNKSQSKWMFYDNQYGMSAHNNTNINADYTGFGAVTHFGWGTSGYNHGAVLYHPWNTGYDANSYFAYGDASLNLGDETGIADWGYNLITNGMYAYKQWRTLTKDEWNYIISERSDASNKIGFATITNVYVDKGVVLLPDNWTDPYEDCFVPGNDDGYATNQYNVSQWQSMENAGAVFLPAGGRRYNTFINSPENCGVYWSTTRLDNNSIYTLYFDNTNIPMISNNARYYGCVVRLVCE